MRYALRKQEKIKEKLGINFLELLNSSLRIFFLNNQNPKEFILKKEDTGSDNDWLHVPSADRENDTSFQFAVTRIQFDVINLSYYSAIG